MQATLALCAAGILTVDALASTYARMLRRVSDYNRLRREREALNGQYRRLGSAARQSSAQLGSPEWPAAGLGLDHGFRLATEYGHLSRVCVRMGETLKRG